MRSPPSTSLTRRIERSWPTASGVSVSGNVTVSRSVSTGSCAGSSGGAPIATSSPPSRGVAISITTLPSAWLTGTVREPLVDLIGSSTVSMPSS